MQLNQNKIKKINLEPKYLNVAGVLVFLLIAVVGYLLADNLAKQVNAKKLQADNKKAEIDARWINIQKFKDLKKNVSDFPDKVEILDNIKNDQQSIEQLISQLEKIAYVAGVNLPIITPDTSGQSSLQATITVTGNYDSIKKFLNGIENNQLIINVSNISISSQGSILSVGLNVKAGL